MEKIDVNIIVIGFVVKNVAQGDVSMERIGFTALHVHRMPNVNTTGAIPLI